MYLRNTGTQRERQGVKKRGVREGGRGEGEGGRERERRERDREREREGEREFWMWILGTEDKTLTAFQNEQQYSNTCQVGNIGFSINLLVSVPLVCQ